MTKVTDLYGRAKADVLSNRLHSGNPGDALDTALYSCEPCREYSQLPYSYDVCTDTSVERTPPAGFQSVFLYRCGAGYRAGSR